MADGSVLVAEVLLEFAEPVISEDGRAFLARACGSEMAGGLWQGWIEFVPVEGGEPLRSARATTWTCSGHGTEGGLDVDR